MVFKYQLFFMFYSPPFGSFPAPLIPLCRNHHSLALSLSRNQGLFDKYDNLHDTGIYAGLSILGGLSFGLLVHALLDTGHSHDVPHLPHEGVPVPEPASAAVSGVSSDDAVMLAKEKAAGNGDSSSIGVPTAEATQPPSPATEVSSDNLKALIASRKGRALTDFKGLQPVCWNVIAGDLVRHYLAWLGVAAAVVCVCSCGFRPYYYFGGRADGRADAHRGRPLI